VKIYLRPAAAGDVEAAVRWYEERRTGLGDVFLEVVDLTLARLRENPRPAPVVHRDTRRVLLPRFPYVLFYRLIGDGIVVVGCFHACRDLRRWERRQ